MNCISHWFQHNGPWVSSRDTRAPVCCTLSDNSEMPQQKRWAAPLPWELFVLPGNEEFGKAFPVIHYFKENNLVPAPRAGQGKWDQVPHKPSQKPSWPLASLTASGSRGQMLESEEKTHQNLVDSLSNVEIFVPSKCILQGNLIFSLNWK